jgi:hypothetical protein
MMSIENVCVRSIGSGSAILPYSESGEADDIIVAHSANCGHDPTKIRAVGNGGIITDRYVMSPSPTVRTQPSHLPTSCDVGYKYITVSDGLSIPQSAKSAQYVNSRKIHQSAKNGISILCDLC